MHEHDSPPDIHTRVRNLERRNRRLSGLVLLLTGLTALQLWTAWTVSVPRDMPSGGDVTVTDVNGAVVAVLGAPAGRPGTGQLHLGALDGTVPDPRNGLTLQGGVLGAQFRLHNRSGRVALQLGEDARSRGGFLQVYDGMENLRIVLGLRPDGQPALLFLDEQGQVTWQAPERM